MDQQHCSKKQKGWELSESESDSKDFHTRVTKKLASSRGSLRESKRRLISEEEEERSRSPHGRKLDPRSQTLKQKCRYLRPETEYEEDEDDEEEEEERRQSQIVQKGGHRSQKPKLKHGGSSSEIEEEEEKEYEMVEEEDEVRSKSGLGLTLQEVEEE